MLMKKLFIVSGIMMGSVAAYANIPSSEYMGQKIAEHANNVQNPHSVTKAQIGLGNVENLNQTNADNLTSGTVSFARLPVGTSENTVAAGDDVRFNTIATAQPNGTPPSGSVFVWFE